MQTGPLSIRERVRVRAVVALASCQRTARSFFTTCENVTVPLALPASVGWDKRSAAPPTAGIYLARSHGYDIIVSEVPVSSDLRFYNVLDVGGSTLYLNLIYFT